MTTDNPEDLVRLHLAQGKSLDEVATVLIERRFGPITTIKAMRLITGKSLGELKAIVDRVLGDSGQTENDPLRSAAMAALMMMDNERHDQH